MDSETDRITAANGGICPVQTPVERRKAEIRSILEDGPKTRQKIKESVSGRAEDVLASLDEMVSAGEVTKTGTGRRGSPKTYALVVSVPYSPSKGERQREPNPASDPVDPPKECAGREARQDVIRSILEMSDKSLTAEEIRDKWPSGPIPKPSLATLTKDLDAGSPTPGPRWNPMWFRKGPDAEGDRRYNSVKYSIRALADWVYCGRSSPARSERRRA